MKGPTEPLDLSRLKVLPLHERHSLTRADEILLDPDAEPACLSDANADLVRQSAACIVAARAANASVILIYGAHLLRNGAARLIERLLANGWLTHLATSALRRGTNGLPDAALAPHAGTGGRRSNHRCRRRPSADPGAAP